VAFVEHQRAIKDRFWIANLVGAFGTRFIWPLLLNPITLVGAFGGRFTYMAALFAYALLVCALSTIDFGVEKSFPGHSAPAHSPAEKVPSPIVPF